MSRLIQLDAQVLVDELLALGVVTREELARRRVADHRLFVHEGRYLGEPGQRELAVQTTLERYELERANAETFGIVRWRHASISVRGQLQERLKDQKRIGRTRAGGERSPVPLPDWYELTHIVYEHAEELGFDPRQPVWQFLPAPAVPDMRLNIAEALHLRQPA